MVINHDIYKPLYENKDKFIVLVTGGRGCEHPDTPIMMANLTIKKIKDIKVGDKVMGDDGTPRNVLDIMRGNSQMYCIHQKNAEDYIVNDGHILTLKKADSCTKPYGEITKFGTPRHPNGRYPEYKEIADIPISDLLNKSKRFFNCFRGIKSKSIPYQVQSVRIDPYILGVWLGDGTSSSARVTNPDIEIINELKAYAYRMGVVVSELNLNKTAHTYAFVSPNTHKNPILELLRSYNLIENKHIPQEYISNSEEVRLELLAGLIDTDGCYDKRGDYEITQKSQHLAKQIKFLADTLGFRTKLTEKRCHIGEKDCGIYYRLNISGDICRIPCRVERKKASDIHYSNRSWLTSTISIEPIGNGDWCGICLDGNQRYLHADGTITHNSGKSFSTSTFIERLTFELGRDTTGHKIAHQILYSRYTMVSAGMSIIPEVMDKIESDGTSKFFKKVKNDIENVMTGGRIMFRGIKTSSGNQTAKLKSIKGLSVFVCDEAEEFVSERDFETIVFSIRQQGLKNLVVIIMNPSNSNHFIYQKYIKDTHKLVEYDGVPVQISTHPNVLHIHTSYLDNLENLAPQFIEEAKAMKGRDPEHYAHIFMGRWDDVAEGAIFKKWGIVKEFPETCKKVGRGLDFGYVNDVSACVKCGIASYPEGDDLYIDEQFYATGMTSHDLIRELRKDDSFVYADSADQRLIDEIALGGVIIYPTQKGPGSIVAGIDKMNTFRNIFITQRSIHIQDEFRNYTWDKDKDGNYVNQPIDAYNHAIDATRYYVMAKLLGKIMKPKNVTKDQLGIY